MLHIWLDIFKSSEDPTALSKHQLLSEVPIQFLSHPLNRSMCWLIAGNLSSGSVSGSHPLFCILFLLPGACLWLFNVFENQFLWKEGAVSGSIRALVQWGNRGNAFINNHSLLSNRLRSRLCCQVPVGRTMALISSSREPWERSADLGPMSPAHPQSQGSEQPWA